GAAHPRGRGERAERRGVHARDLARAAAKLFYSAFYLFVVLFGFGGIIWMLKNGFKEMNYLLLIVTGLYFVLVFPFIFKLDEYRYFVIGYPFFIIASVYTLVNGYQLIYKKNT
ncbi:MAG TPA: hypothetical protein VLB84_13540, partial [Bacteroidia bacterium]|nr:hypothetical protein [Bacteroidia bacterium]